MNAVKKVHGRLHILVSDVAIGGAAIACRRLYDGLAARQCAVKRLIMSGPGVGDAIACDAWPGILAFFAKRLAARLGMKSGPGAVLQAFSAESAAIRTVRFLTRGAGVINLHNIHEAGTFGFVRKLPGDVPLVWTLHDMWPLTGYCWYSYDCDKYLAGCEGECPRRGNCGHMFQEPSAGWRTREKFYRENGHRLSFVAPSAWLAGEARKRLGNLCAVHHIPYGLNLSVFKPVMHANLLKETFGIPARLKVILAGADSMADERKGSQHLVNAVNLLRREGGGDFLLVVFGSGAQGRTGDALELGRISDESLLNLYYNMADVFVLPSLADNLPNTLLEATAAGTPCVTFNVGGCPEIVREGVTGYVAGHRDDAGLARSIRRVIDMPDAEKTVMRTNCRRLAEQEYGSDLQASRYCDLFASFSHTTKV